MKASYLFRQFWTGLARRSGRAPKQVQRLTGFEALEPRTVLSASGMMMFGPGGFGESHRQEYYGFESSGHSPHGGADFASMPEHQGMGRERLMSPAMHDIAPHETLVVTRSGAAETYRQPPSAMDSTAPSPMVRPLSVENNLSPTLTIVSTYVSRTSPVSSELIIVRSLPSTRLTAELNSGASVALNEYRALGPVFTLGLAERRMESPPPVSISVPREASGYVSQARLTASNTSAAEGEGSTATNEHGLSLRSSNSAVLAQLSLAPSASLERADSSASDESGRLDERADQAAKADETSEADGEMIDLGSAELARQRRKTVVSEAVHTPLSSRLERLADIPLTGDAQAFFRDLARLIDGSSAAASLIGQQSGAAATPDDGLIEMLAADVSSLMIPSSGLPSGPAAGTAGRTTTLEPGVALYQAFEIATSEGASAGEVVPQNVAGPAAEPAEQLARAD